MRANSFDGNDIDIDDDPVPRLVLDHNKDIHLGNGRI